MVDSGSAALFLAVELLNLPRGSEVITSPLTFSTDLSALVRAGLVPVFVDVARSHPARPFAQYSSYFRANDRSFVPPRQQAELETARLSNCLQVRPDAGFSRADLQAGLSERGGDTRTAWTGNAARQPFMQGVPFRPPEGGLPHADAVMHNTASCCRAVTRSMRTTWRLPARASTIFSLLQPARIPAPCPTSICPCGGNCLIGSTGSAPSCCTSMKPGG